jgi:hypothetical protein
LNYTQIIRSVELSKCDMDCVQNMLGRSSSSDDDTFGGDAFALLRWACAVDPAAVASIIENGPEQPPLTDAQVGTSDQ